MAQVIVRNLDDATVVRLKRKAKSQKKSLEQLLREIVTEAGMPDKRELRERAAEIAEKTRFTDLDAVELVREDRTR